ncbi:uncharacterized protein A1O5_09286 [Cladophialophora psammophila CBS 110553]|uniref:Major facilitator superfamily (MFS) profile domain-containing protein n=1 Tax=Cladophialophora psammophila CBS 110553 TaxID=1182543 RepID=W9WH67_9EURO|nr:uncharacterized protein A1O5_09286 [Cladophialophora psammophila CBS 110553]EXJ67273.1 hypothetical protein A1O5_09286 [Cladophialophora psammophila CBS 110553]
MATTTETQDKDGTTFIEHSANLEPGLTVEKTLTDAEVTGKLDSISTSMANQGTHTEHELSYLEALKIYRKGAFWSIFFSLSIIMRAYDIEITGNFFALPSFQSHFGHQVPGHGYQIPANWQVAMSMGSLVGQIIGAYIVAWPMEKIGRRKTLAVYLLFTSALVFMQVFAPNIEVLTTSMYLSGIIWGGYCVLAPTYASECLPMKLRGFLTGYINLCYVMGQFIQTGITRGFINRVDKWAYKIPYCIQWAWPIIILPGLVWAPESPWWLVRQHKMEEAERSLKRLSEKHEKVEVTNTLAMMVKTDLYEREVEVGTTYIDCWKGPNRRRMEICIMLFVIQNFSGNPVGFATYLFEQVGLSAKHSFDMGLGLNGLGFLGTLASAIPLIYFGRRLCYMAGLAYIIVILFIVAFMCLASDYAGNPSYSWAQAALLCTLQFVWQMTLGPLTYVVVCETPSTKLRSKTIALATVIDAATGLVTTVIGPYLLNPGAANAGAKIEFLYGGISVISLTWCFFRLPETKDRTFEELDILFEKQVPARQFKDYVIDRSDEQ